MNDLCTIVLTREEARELYDDLAKRWHCCAQTGQLVRDLRVFLDDAPDFDDEPTWPGSDAATRAATVEDYLPTTEGAQVNRKRLYEIGLPALLRVLTPDGWEEGVCHKLDGSASYCTLDKYPPTAAPAFHLRAYAPMVLVDGRWQLEDQTGSDVTTRAATVEDHAPTTGKLRPGRRRVKWPTKRRRRRS